MKKLSKLVFTMTLFTSLFFLAVSTVSAIPQSINSIESIEPSINQNYYESVEKIINGTNTNYIYQAKDVDEITKKIEDELNENNINERDNSGSIELKLIGKQRKSTGSKKIANQPAGGVYFSNGGQIYYKDGSSFSIPLTLSVAGKVFGFAVGIGSFSKSPTTYGINIPKGSYYHGYVDKTYDLYVYEQYRVSPDGQHKTFERYAQRSVLYSIKFDARKV